jgi:hypothetical protein
MEPSREPTFMPPPKLSKRLRKHFRRAHGPMPAKPSRPLGVFGIHFVGNATAMRAACPICHEFDRSEPRTPFEIMMINAAGGIVPVCGKCRTEWAAPLNAILTAAYSAKGSLKVIPDDLFSIMQNLPNNHGLILMREYVQTLSSPMEIETVEVLSCNTIPPSAAVVRHKSDRRRTISDALAEISAASK